MQTGYKISIIMPVYNSEKYLDETLRSVLSQRYSDWELLIIDDGSTDRSAEIIDGYRGKDSRIHYWKIENQGVSHARNIALDHAGGEAVLFLDSDDILKNDALYLMEQRLRQTGADLVYCGMWHEYPDRRTESIVPIEETMVSISDFWTVQFSDLFQKSLYQCIGTKLYRKELLEKLRFHEEYRYHEDELFVTEVLEQVRIISFIKQPLYGYRHHDDSLSNHEQIGDYEAASAFYNAAMRQITKQDNISCAKAVLNQFQQYCLLGELKQCYQSGKTFTREDLMRLMNREESRQALNSELYTGRSGNFVLKQLKAGRYFIVSLLMKVRTVLKL